MAHYYRHGADCPSGYVADLGYDNAVETPPIFSNEPPVRANPTRRSTNPDSATLNGILSWITLRNHRQPKSTAETCSIPSFHCPLSRADFHAWLNAVGDAQSDAIIALIFGVTRQSVWRWRVGTRNPSRTVLILAGILAREAVDLADGLSDERSRSVHAS
jgi:hypothetical protein